MTRRMIAQCLIASLACLNFSVHASSTAFSNSQFKTSATAIAGTSADSQFSNGSASHLPLTSSAVAVDAKNFAAGGAIAAVGLLSTSAEASSQPALTSATGSSEFVGDFTGGGIFTFQFNYTSQNFTDAGAFSSSTLYFLLKSNGATWLSEIVPVTDFFSLSLFIPYGTSNTVDLLLSSEATSTTGSSAQNVATLAFQVSQVPEPSTWLLIFAGFVFLIAKTPIKTLRCRPDVAGPLAR